MKDFWDEKSQCYRDENGRRKCSFDDETIGVVIDNCKEFLKYRKRLYIEDIEVLLHRALVGVRDKKDLTPVEEMAIKSIRAMIKGL